MPFRQSDSTTTTAGAGSTRAVGRLDRSLDAGRVACDRRLRCDLVFGLACLAFAVWRFLILASPGTPPGVDGGNWLAFGHALFGDSVRAHSIVYPPSVPAIVAGAVGVAGTVDGVALVAAGASVVPAVGAYAVLQARRLGWSAVALGAVLLSAASVGEAAAWGGYPQLLGLGLGALFLAAFERWLRLRTRRLAATAGALLALLSATSHLVAPVAALAALLMLPIIRADRRRPVARRWSWREALLLAGPSLLLLPVYARLGPAVLGSASDMRAHGARLSVAGLPGSLSSVFRDLPVVWSVLLVAAVATPLALHRRRASLWPMTTAMVGATFLMMFVTREPRLLYVASLPAVVACGCWFEPGAGLSRRYRRVLTGSLTVVAIAQSALGIGSFREQRQWYSVVTPGVLAGIEWLRTTTPGDALVVVTAVADRPLGWWVEGLAERRTLTDAPLRWLAFPDERHRAEQALTVLGDGFGDRFSDGAALVDARRLGAEYLLVAKSWRGYRPQAIATLRHLRPEVVVFDNPSVLILRVP